MSLNIYNIPDWAANTNYNIDDIVYYNGYYYYCVVSHNSGNEFSSEYWSGTINYNGTTKPYFLWIPSYNSEAPIRPSVKEVKLGDGYTQRSPDGINNVLLNFNLLFDLRSESQTNAILHFLHTRAGAESFVFSSFFPYNQNKLYICSEWTTPIIFKDNYSIRCVFQETPV